MHAVVLPVAEGSARTTLRALGSGEVEDLSMLCCHVGMFVVEKKERTMDGWTDYTASSHGQAECESPHLKPVADAHVICIWWRQGLIALSLLHGQCPQLAPLVLFVATLLWMINR